MFQTPTLLSLQAWRGSQFFDDVFKLVGVPVITVQLRYDGWVTEMQVRRAAALVQLGGWIALGWLRSRRGNCARRLGGGCGDGQHRANGWSKLLVRPAFTSPLALSNTRVRLALCVCVLPMQDPTEVLPSAILAPFNPRV